MNPLVNDPLIHVLAVVLPWGFPVFLLLIFLVVRAFQHAPQVHRAPPAPPVCAYRSPDPVSLPMPPSSGMESLPVSSSDTLEAIRERAAHWRSNPTQGVSRRAAEDREILLQTVVVLVRERAQGERKT